MRLDIFLAQDWRCWFCGELFTRTGDGEPIGHHLIPHKGDPELFFDRSNVVGIHKFPCHDQFAQQIEVRGYHSAQGADGWPLDPNHPANRK